MVQLFFRPRYVWFLVHLYIGLIPNSSGQLAELISLYYFTRVDLYSHQILLGHNLIQVMVCCLFIIQGSVIWAAIGSSNDSFIANHYHDYASKSMLNYWKLDNKAVES